MASCSNHPWVEAPRGCDGCGFPFCEACLVGFLGQTLCGPCRDRRLQEMSAPPEGRLSGTGTVQINAWLSGGWRVVSGGVLTFAIAFWLHGLVGLLTCYLALPAMQCGLYLMA